MSSFKRVTVALTPKDDECIVDEIKGKDSAYFEATMKQAMTEGRRVLSPDGVGIIVFAHKSTTGWESQLQAMIDAGWIMTASWPIDTEMGTRLRAMDSAALASSVHLVCRPRLRQGSGGQARPDEGSGGQAREDHRVGLPTEASAEVGDWRDVLAELPRRIHDRMPRLAEEGVVGADAIFACLGPAREVFSRYSRVEKASGEAVPLKEYLEQVWAAVAKEALTMIFSGADATVFEEDARLTALWLWTLKTDETGNGGDGETRIAVPLQQTAELQQGGVITDENLPFLERFPFPEFDQLVPQPRLQKELLMGARDWLQTHRRKKRKKTQRACSFCVVLSFLRLFLADLL